MSFDELCMWAEMAREAWLADYKARRVVQLVTYKD